MEFLKFLEFMSSDYKKILWIKYIKELDKILVSS